MEQQHSKQISQQSEGGGGVFVANDHTYLLVHYLDGRVEHIFCRDSDSPVVFDPQKHKRIDAIPIDAHGMGCPQSKPGDIYVADKTFFLKVFYVNGNVQEVHAPQINDKGGNDVGQTVIVFDPSKHKRIVRMFYSMEYLGDSTQNFPERGRMSHHGSCMLL